MGEETGCSVATRALSAKRAGGRVGRLARATGASVIMEELEEQGEEGRRSGATPAGVLVLGLQAWMPLRPGATQVLPKRERRGGGDCAR